MGSERGEEGQEEGSEDQEDREGVYKTYSLRRGGEMTRKIA